MYQRPGDTWTSKERCQRCWAEFVVVDTIEEVVRDPRYGLVRVYTRKGGCKCQERVTNGSDFKS